MPRALVSHDDGLPARVEPYLRDDHGASCVTVLGSAAEPGDRFDTRLRHTQRADLLVGEPLRQQPVPDPLRGLPGRQPGLIHQRPVVTVPLVVQVAAFVEVRELAAGPLHFPVEVPADVAHRSAAIALPRCVMVGRVARPVITRQSSDTRAAWQRQDACVALYS
jgi:hypothetical protein